MLATIVWAALASAFVGYYYLENSNNSAQLKSANNSLDAVASSYFDASSKYNSLQSEYGAVYGNYYYLPQNSDYTPLMPSLGTLITDFSGNYSSLLAQTDLNGTYNQLLNDYQTLSQTGNVSRSDFENLLGEYYDLFSLSAIRDLGLSISNAATLSVNVEINENGTVQWSNKTQVPAGTTLFEITQQISVVKYTYDAAYQPGHVFVDSINNLAEYTNPSGTAGYSWLWYYSNDNGKTWISGPVGCDAWLLSNGSLYLWNYTSWSFP